MIKDYFLNKVESAVEKAIEAGKLGQMTEYTKGTLVAERPKNLDFGDYAVNVSSLARSAKIAPPLIAQAIVDFIDKEDNDYTVIAGFINFKAGETLLVNLIDEIFAKKSLFGKPEKIDKEKAEIERLAKDKPKSDAKREELIKKIEDFEITREKK